VSGRIGHDLGDYGSLGDNQIPVGRIEGDYETPATLNDTWGFKSGDRNWKSNKTILYLLVDLASKGINYLLNVGPTAKGDLPGACVTRLREIGAWMKGNGESIYGSSASPFPYELPWGRMTEKPGRLYLHIFAWPRGRLAIHGLKNHVRSAYLLRDPSRRLAVTQRRDLAAGFSVLTLSGFGKRTDRHVSVVVLEIEGKARVEETPIQQPDGTVLLPAFMARRIGTTKGDFRISRAGFTEGWSNTSQGLAWTLKIIAPGRYRINVLSSGKAENRGKGKEDAHRLRFSLSAPAQGQRSFPLAMHERVSSPRAQYFPEIVTHGGTVSLPSAGSYVAELRATKVSLRAVEGIGVSGVRLELIESDVR
jgi:alpha-L-fucosidase